MESICRDLAGEYESLHSILAGLSETEWETITPFFNWTVKDQLSHLAYFEDIALIAATDRWELRKAMEDFLENLKPGDDFFRVINAMTRDMPAKELLGLWKERCGRLIAKLETLDPEVKLPWFGPDMNSISFATARIMEVWAHGRDVLDALRIRIPQTDRLKHIAHLGVITMGWSFVSREIKIPRVPVRVELTAPSGEVWTWGPEDVENWVSGPAEDFCLVVVQRRNVEDVGLEYQGEIASEWLRIAQAFAGPPENHPAPGVRVVDYD